MLQSASAFIGLRYARASKSNHFIAFINFFSVMGITLGIAALITVSSVMNGFESQLKERILGLQAQLVVQLSPDDPRHKALANLPSVTDSMAFIETEGLIQSDRGLRGVQIQGVEPEVIERASPLSEHMLYGELPQLVAGQYNVVLGYGLARDLAVQPGDRIRIVLPGATRYTPFGPMPAQRKFTVSGVFSLNSALDSQIILMNVEDASRLLKQRTTEGQSIRLFLQDAFEYQAVSKKVSEITPAAQHNWRERQGQLFDAVKMEKNMMSVMLMLIVVVAAFNIVSALAMVVKEKVGDIAILQTQGMTRAQISRVFLLNGLYNGVKGTLFGLILGVILCYQLNNILHVLGVQLALPDQAGLPVDIHPWQVVVIVTLAILLSMVASLFPARGAAKVLPADALRYE